MLWNEANQSGVFWKSSVLCNANLCLEESSTSVLLSFWVKFNYTCQLYWYVGPFTVVSCSNGVNNIVPY